MCSGCFGDYEDGDYVDRPEDSMTDGDEDNVAGGRGNSDRGINQEAMFEVFVSAERIVEIYRADVTLQISQDLVSSEGITNRQLEWDAKPRSDDVLLRRDARGSAASASTPASCDHPPSPY